MTSPKPNSSGVKTPTSESTADIQERIRRRAYELYEQHGREDGHDMDDWLQAEGELNSQRRKATAA